MKFEMNDTLKQFFHQGNHPHLATRDHFEIDEREYLRHLEEVLTQHPQSTPSEAAARSLYRIVTMNNQALTNTPVMASTDTRTIERLEPKTLEHLKFEGTSSPPQRASEIPKDSFTGDYRRWFRVVILELGMILFFLLWMCLRMRAQFDAPIIQLENAAVQQAVIPAGLVKLNCSTNMTCTWDSTNRRFNMTASSTAGTAWSSLTAPTVNLSLSHGANTTTFTWGSATGALVDLFSLTDSLNNTGTGHLWKINTASGSTVKPIQFSSNGNGVEMSAAGGLAAIGTGTINATQYKSGTASGTGACASNTWASTLNDAAAPTCVQPGFSNLSGAIALGQTPLTTLGDLLFVNVTPALARLAGNTTTVKQYLSQTGTGTVSAAPTWAQVAFADLSGLAVKAQLPATTVYTDQANSWTAGAQDFSAAASLKIVVAAGAAPTASGQMAYDSTANRFNGGVNAANKLFVMPDSTDTLTNKTLDFNATGNHVKRQSKIYFPMAGCSNATAGTSWDLPTASAAVAACLTGTNTQQGVLQFADGQSAQYTLVLPSDWSSADAVDSRIFFQSPDLSGTVIFNIATSCSVTDGSAGDDNAFNTANAYSTITLATASSRSWAASVTAITMTGCAAGNILHLKVSRATDTAVSAVNAKGAEITLRRTT